MAVPDLHFRHQDAETVHLGRTVNRGRSLTTDDLSPSSSLVPSQNFKNVHPFTQTQTPSTYLQHFEAVPGISSTVKHVEDEQPDFRHSQQASFISNPPLDSSQPGRALHLNPRVVPIPDQRHQKPINPRDKNHFIFAKLASQPFVNQITQIGQSSPLPRRSIISNHPQVNFLQYPKEFYQTHFLSRPVTVNVHHKQRLLKDNFIFKRKDNQYPQTNIVYDKTDCRMYHGIFGVTCKIYY